MFPRSFRASTCFWASRLAAGVLPLVVAARRATAQRPCPIVVLAAPTEIICSFDDPTTIPPTVAGTDCVGFSTGSAAPGRAATSTVSGGLLHQNALSYSHGASGVLQ